MVWSDVVVRTSLFNEHRQGGHHKAVLPVNSTFTCLISCAPFFLVSAAVPVPCSLTSSRLGLRFRFHAASLLPRPGCGSGSLRSYYKVEPAGGRITTRKSPEDISVFRASHRKRRRLPTLPHCIAVPSAQVGLTSLFGMGRGGTPPQ